MVCDCSSNFTATAFSVCLVSLQGREDKRSAGTEDGRK